LNAIAKKIGIEALLERDIRSLSTGEMNTALIAKALIKRPKLLILDEPFDGLDAPSRNALAIIINDLMGSNTQVILITHRFAEMVPNITHVLLLRNGKIFKSGKKEDIFTAANINRVYDLLLPTSTGFMKLIPAPYKTTLKKWAGSSLPLNKKGRHRQGC
jgi:ABC-type Mn2+/Zn2+ transport system ATPase subunit